MLKKSMLYLMIVAIAVTVFSVYDVAAQDTRKIVPFPREVWVETVDAMTKMPKSTFCIGVNTVDLKLTNNSQSGLMVSVVNRDTMGRERTLYNGWLNPGNSYLSKLLGMSLQLTGPAGTEMVRADISEYGQTMSGRWVSFNVQNCGTPDPGTDPTPGYGQVWAQVYPSVIEQGQKGMIVLQTSAGYQPNMPSYIEILNSWGQLWKRIPVTKQSYQRYEVALPVGTKTKPGMLTYTVNVWSEGWRQRQQVASTCVSFYVARRGEAYPMPYNQGAAMNSGCPDMSGYSQPMPSMGGMMPEYGTPSYVPAPYGMTPYSAGYQTQGTFPTERQIQ